MSVHMDWELDELFSRFHDDQQSPNPRPLAAWIEAYPQLAGSLVQWATDIPSLAAADVAPASAAFTARSIAAGMDNLRRLGLGADVGGVTSLNDAARARGARPRQIAEELGIGMSLFAKLNRRLIAAGSVPPRLIDRLADALRVSAREIAEYLSGPPMLAGGAAYRSEGAPAVTAVQEFEAALSDCSDMTDEQKRAWS